MDAFLQIREGPTWTLLDADAPLQNVIEALQDSCLWFFPVPRGVPAVDQSLPEVYTQRVMSGLQAMSAQFKWQLPAFHDIAEYSQWLAEKVPSLESMNWIEHTLEVHAAQLCLLLQDPTKVSSIGPKKLKDDPVFVQKVQTMQKITDWTDYLRNVYKAQRQAHIDALLDDESVTSLPANAVSQEHFFQNYATADNAEHLEAQKNAIVEKFAALHFRSADLAPYLWVDPEPIEGKSFQVLLYKG